jgi:hypothetical protein
MPDATNKQLLELIATVSINLRDEDSPRTTQPDPLRELVSAARDAYHRGPNHNVRLDQALKPFDDLEV